MKMFAKTLIAGTALLTLTVLPASAADSTSHASGALIINGQVNLGPVWSQLNADVSHVADDVSATATAVGNSAQIFTLSNTVVQNDQYQGGNVGAEVNADIHGVGGNAQIGATAVCNGASISTDPDITAVKSNQTCGADDPSATVNADVSNVGGVVAIGAMSVANQIEIDSNALKFPVNTYQENYSGTFSTINADVHKAGAVGLSATAAGNTAQIIHY